MVDRRIFKINIPDGNSFFGVVKILKTIATPCCFVFYKDRMIMQVYPSDPNKCVSEGLLLSININPNEFLSYEVDMDLINDPDNDRHVIFINSSVLKDQIGNSNKKQGICMYQYEDSSQVHVETHSASIRHGRINTENKDPSDYKEFDSSDFQRPINQPNCRITLFEFVEQIKSIVKIKINKAQICVGDNYLCISATSNSNISNKEKVWVQNDSERGEEITSIDVKKNVIGVFGHMQPLSNGCGVIRVYAEKESGVIRFVTKVGHFGELFIYVFQDQN